MKFRPQFNHKPHNKLISTMATFNSQLQLCNCTNPAVHSISALTSITAAAQAAHAHSSTKHLQQPPPQFKLKPHSWQISIPPPLHFHHRNFTLNLQSHHNNSFKKIIKITMEVLYSSPATHLEPVLSSKPGHQSSITNSNFGRA
ncbi:hypothetical protein M0R45_019535 [Rubus argutus]|uniref:Uncharacterized protein n=1 Tax=Rubus argutus TaxID=59490 RepID=A0AAW1X6I7_RUBAR